MRIHWERDTESGEHEMWDGDSLAGLLAQVGVLSVTVERDLTYRNLGLGIEVTKYTKLPYDDDESEWE